MPVGRPTKYTDDMPERVRALLSEGWSKVSCAAQLGIGERTLYEWAEKFPQFSQAIKDGEAECEYWWEDKYRDQLLKGELSPAMMIFVLKTRFGYKETNTLELTGKDGGPIEANSKILQVVGVSSDADSDT